MLGTRYESYSDGTNGLPFVLNDDLVRTPLIYSKEYNWHEDLEIQLCLEGNGWVILNGKKYAFSKGDAVIVGSSVIHYTGSDEKLRYSCLIVKHGFCKALDIDCKNLDFSPVVKSERILKLFISLQEKYLAPSYPCRVAELNGLLIDILVEIVNNYASVKSENDSHTQKGYETVKSAVRFIRENYYRKISLDELAREALTNKYALSREFKRLTGQTVVENINRFRVLKAVELLSQGYSVSQAAAECGFENLSFFTKTFRKYIGRKPSEIRLSVQPTD